MLIIKNKTNAPIEISKVIIYPGENKKVPNARMTDHLRELQKKHIIGVSEISDTTVISSEEIKESNSKNSEGTIPKEKTETSIDPKNVKDSIEIPNAGSRNKKNNSKGEK